MQTNYEIYLNHKLQDPKFKKSYDREIDKLWIHESNLIEGIDSSSMDILSMRAWRKLKDRKLFTLRNILICHKHIVGNESWAGKLRTCNVTVGNHKPMDYSFVRKSMLRWVSKFHNAQTEEFIQKAHIEFEIIHPFQDGNGRTGRMVMNWQRIKAGLEPLILLASERQEYYAWFRTEQQEQTRSQQVAYLASGSLMNYDTWCKTR